MSVIEIASVNYKDILKLEEDFLSLDISVNSTGWVRSRAGQIDKGTFTLKSKGDTDRRVEFREFLQQLIGDYKYNVVYVEDVIQGVNFKTVKSLIQLNTIVDDMKIFGMIDVDRIVRIDNNKWKKYLRQASNYVSVIKKENAKVEIRNCLNLLGFKEDVEQDIYDAMGMAVAVIFKEKILGVDRVNQKPLKKDIRRGYAITQYETKEEALKACKRIAKRRNREVEQVDWSDNNRDLIYLFKQKITQDNADDKVYCITIKSMKTGIIALKKKLDTAEEITYLRVVKKN